MIKFLHIAFLAAGVTAGAFGAASAQTFKAGDVVEIDGAEGPVFAMGGEVEIRGNVSGGSTGPWTVMAAGGSVDIDARIDGGLAVAGGEVEVRGRARSIAASGGAVLVDATIDEDAKLTGGEATLGANSRVGGDLRAVGGELILSGAVDGDAKMTGGEILLEGSVAGDVEISGEDIEIGADAVIGGDLTYYSNRRADIHPHARIAGAVMFNERSASELKDYRDGDFDFGLDGGGVAERAFGALFWFVALGASGALMGAVFPGWLGAVAEAGRDKPVGALIAGVFALVFTPILAVLLMIVVIGLPFGLFLLAIYGALLLVSFIGAGYAFGHLLLDRSNDGEAKIGLFLAGLAIISVAAAIPFIGWIVGAAAFAFGLGAMTLGLLRALRIRQVSDF